MSDYKGYTSLDLKYSRGFGGIKSITMEILIKIICFFIDHSWLSTAHNRRACNRCGHKEKRGPETNYKWVADEEQEEVIIAKPFNPID